MPVAPVRCANRIKGLLQLLIRLALTAVVGCVSAYGFLYVHEAPAGIMPMTTTALVATCGGPASPFKAPGDVIVQIGERIVEHARDLRGVVIGAEAGMREPIELLRNGKRVTVDVELASLPTPQAPD